MKNILNIPSLHHKMECKKDIIHKMVECYAMIHKYSVLAKQSNEEFMNMLVRDFYVEIDMYYALKMDAYWGDVCVTMSPAENRLFTYMLEVAKRENLGVMSVLYNYYHEHYMYEHNDDDESDYDSLSNILKDFHPD